MKSGNAWVLNGLHAQSLQSCLTLQSMDCGPPGSSVHGIFQARILEWVAISSSRDLPDPGIEAESPASLALADGFFTTLVTWKELSLFIHVTCIHSYRLPACVPGAGYL